MAAAQSYPSCIPININDLLALQGVESQRVEFKKAWHNDRRIKGGTYWQVIHTISAFANDYYNVNGGYIIIGVEEKKNRDSSDKRDAVPCGIQGNLETIQKEIAGACRGNIKPPYVPRVQPEVVDSEEGRKEVLVIWVKPSETRPHMCRESDKGEMKYYIRHNAETKVAQEEEIKRLCLENSTPFDDRAASDSGSGRILSEEDIDQGLVLKYLKDISSQLARHKGEPITIYQKMDLVKSISDKVVRKQLVPVFAPLNVALLFFNREPHKFFKGARAEIAIFSHDNYLKDRKEVTGPIHQQIEKCLSFILEKPKDVACHAFTAYPERALREAVVNAFYHRSYEVSDPDPVKIHIKPEFIDIISYPGPDPTLKPEDFSENNVPPVQHRNRRIADFLKLLKLAEGMYTGVGTIFTSMKENKNPKPQFDFSPSYFRVRLPGHPKYIVQSIRGRVDYLCAKGNEEEAVKLIEDFLERDPSMWSETLLTKLIELLHVEDGEDDPKVAQYQAFLSKRKQRRIPLKEELVKWCESETLNISTGVKLITKLVEEDAAFADVSCVVPKVFGLCGVKDDQGRPQLEAHQNAHKIFEAMGEVALTDASVSFQFASCKFNLYVLNTQKDLEFKQRKASSREPKLGTRERRDLFPLLRKAEDYVKTAIQLTSKDDKHHLAMEWRLLGYIHSQRCAIQRSTEKQVTDCYDKARQNDPNIRLNSVFIPAGSRPHYAANSSR